jgi:hypothetical protein
MMARLNDPILMTFLAVTVALCAWIAISPTEALFRIGFRQGRPKPRFAQVMRVIAVITAAEVLFFLIREIWRTP